MDVRVGLWGKLSAEELMLLNFGVGKDSWESLGLQGDPTSPSQRKSVLNIHWKDWCLSWNSNTLATWCEELTHWKRPWCWERLKAGGEEDDRGWDGWMASTQWTWVWVNSRSWWCIGRPGMLQSMGSQRVGHDWKTELNNLGWKSICKRIYICECVCISKCVCVCVCVCVFIYTYIFIKCAMCAKLLQSCPTLFNPMDCSKPGISVHGILQARILE